MEKMSNKQVVAIFIIGVALLLAAFWAGLVIVKQDGPVSANQITSVNTATKPANNAPATTNTAETNSAASNSSGTNDNTRFVVLIGTYGTLDQAKQIEGEIHKDYLAAHVQMPTATNSFYRVIIGPYDKRDADKVASELSNKRKGIMILPWAEN